MNGRTAVGLLTIALTWGCAGCITTQNQKTDAMNISAPSIAKLDETPRVKKDSSVKRNPQARTEIAFGKLREADADSEAAKSNPEAQARLRDEARKAYQQALKIDPNNLEAARALAGVYVKTNDFARALDTYKKAMAKHPKDATLWYDLGLCNQRQRDFPESVRCFTKALELDPENREYLKKLGFTLAYTGQLDQGLAFLTRAQGTALAHYNLARVLVQRNQNDDARRHLTIALRENAQLTEARELLEGLENPDTPVTPRGTSQ